VKKKLTVSLAAALLLSAGAVQAQEAAPDGTARWVHVRIEEADSTKASINLPVSMVDAALQSRGENGFDAGDLELGPGGDLGVDDLRRMWREARGAGDADFVDVRDGDEHVRVYKRDGRLHVKVDEDGTEKVRIDLPASVVDALLGGEGQRLDFQAAARALGDAGQQEVVRIDDGASRVRIWVDDRSGSSRDG
jgi:hypothetical protein